MNKLFIMIEFGLYNGTDYDHGNAFFISLLHKSVSKTSIPRAYRAFSSTSPK